MAEREHKTEVDGYEDKLELLSQNIHRMRYDAVVKFYAHTATELYRQASGDKDRGRVQLAALLTETAQLAEKQREKFEQIWRLCEPHMQKR